MLVVCVCFRCFTGGTWCTKKPDENDIKQRKCGKNTLVATSMASAMVLAMTRKSLDSTKIENEKRDGVKDPWRPPQEPWHPPCSASQPWSWNYTCGDRHSAWRPSCTSFPEKQQHKMAMSSLIPTYFSPTTSTCFDLTLCTCSTINISFIRFLVLKSCASSKF